MGLREKFSPFCASLQKSIDDENWYSALVLAVTLPDICCSIDGTKVDERKSRAPYIAWFDKYIHDFKIEWYGKPTRDTLNGENAYALRCDVLHQGRPDVSKHKYDSGLGYEKIQFGIANKERLEQTGVELKHGIETEEKLMYLNVKIYCKRILEGVNTWLSDNEGSSVANAKSKDLISIIEF